METIDDKPADPLRETAGPTRPATLSVSGVAEEPQQSEPEMAARLRLVLNRLVRRLRSETPGDLSPSLHSALVTVERQGSITLGQLAASERVTPPSVTRMVATLEGLGLLRREADLHDRRVARVSLTPAGLRVVQRSRTRKTAYLARRLRRLDAAEISVLREALPVLERLLEEGK